MQPVFFIIGKSLGGSLLCFGHFWDIADAIQYNTGAVGVGVQRFAGGNAGKHQYGGHAAFQTGDHIGIHAVADHDCLGGVALQHAKTGAHHQGIGFTTEISLLAGGHFDGSDQCAAGWSDAVLDGAGDIGIGTDKFSAGHDQVAFVRVSNE